MYIPNRTYTSAIPRVSSLSGFGGNPEKENGRNRIGFKFTEWKIVIVECEWWRELEWNGYNWNEQCVAALK